jgi:hypothetical protein
MEPDESTPLFSRFGQSLPIPEEMAAWGDKARSLSNDVTRGPEESAGAIHTETGTTLLVEPTSDELIQAALDDKSQKRLWLRTIIPLLQLRSHDSDPSGRVQLAYDVSNTFRGYHYSNLEGTTGVTGMTQSR